MIGTEWRIQYSPRKRHLLKPTRYYCINGDVYIVYMSVYKYLSLFARLLTEIFRTLVEEKLHYRVEILEAEGEQQLARHNGSETADTDNATLCLNPGCVVVPQID